MSGFLAIRAQIQSACSASVNGFLPPIGKAAGLPVSLQRAVQRIAVETLTSQRAVATRRLIPAKTAATTRPGGCAEQNQGTEIVDPDTVEIMTA